MLKQSQHTVSAPLSLYRPFELVDTISNRNGWSKSIKLRISDHINIWLANLMSNVIGIKQKSSVVIWNSQ